jgi:O-antigen/teichoic acid export membrane protein
MAMLMVIVGFAQAYSDIGLSNAIIYRQDVTSNQLSTLYWVNVMAGIIIFLILVLAIPLTVAFYHEPRLESPMRSLNIVFLISPIGQQYQILLQKELRFKTLAFCEISSKTVGFAVAILSAWAGMGIYALVWCTLAAATTLSLMFFVSGWSLHRTRLHFDLKDTKGFIQFGLYQIGERSVNYVNSNLDKLIIGRMLGAGALGYYNLACNLVFQPILLFNSVIARVAFPVFARLQSQHEALKNGYFKILQIISSVNFAPLFGLAAVAPVLVLVLFGKQWIPAIPLIQLLALFAIFITIGNTIGSLLLAKGRVDLGFKWNLLILFTQPFGIVLGIYLGGLRGVASALLIMQVSYFLLGYRFLVSSLLGPCWKGYVASMSPAFCISFTMSLAVWGLLLALRQSNLDPGLLLAIGIGTGVIYFSLATLITRRAELSELLRYAGFFRHDT